MTYDFNLPDITNDIEVVHCDLNKKYRCRITVATCGSTEEFNELVSGFEERLGKRPQNGLWGWTKGSDSMHYYFSGGAGYIYAKRIKELIGCP